MYRSRMTVDVLKLTAFLYSAGWRLLKQSMIGVHIVPLQTKDTVQYPRWRSLKCSIVLEGEKLLSCDKISCRNRKVFGSR